MFAYIWPIALIVLSDVVYHICAKSSPADMDPLAALTITYLIGAAGSLVMYLLLNRGSSLPDEYRKLNWAPFVLGLAIIGLEAGCLYAYRNGWQVNTMSIVKGTIVAAVLVFVGRFVYCEALSWNKLVGAALCIAGLVFINLK